jgi:hypothetical protein
VPRLSLATPLSPLDAPQAQQEPLLLPSDDDRELLISFA